MVVLRDIASTTAVLSDEWDRWMAHDVQRSCWECESRFQVTPAGRRSGKSRLYLRKGIKAAATHSISTDGRIVFAAPTHAQAREIFWEPLLRLVPSWMQVREPVLGPVPTMFLPTARVQVMGLDRPARVEGSPLDWICLDEYADMKPTVWTRHVKPALDTRGRPGKAAFIGVPEGRNHFHALYKAALEGRPEWSAFTWKSADILPAEVIEQAKRDLDEQTYLQEYEAQFVSFAGRAYYGFTDENIARCEYDPRKTLILCFDFNWDPAICVICQESEDCTETYVVGEVFIRNANTESVCRKVLGDWGSHPGDVEFFGDATGGAKHSSQTAGSSWDQVEEWLYGHFGYERCTSRVATHNPSERSRVNAMNARICTIDGRRRLFVDPKCKNMVNDLEGVTVVEGGSGELDKKKHKLLSHLSDALGYFVAGEHPTSEAVVSSQEVLV